MAQQTEDAVVPISATLDMATPTVTLNWELNAAIADLLLIRREKDASTWFIMLDTMGADLTTFTDPFVTAGETYEYGMIRAVNGINAFGYITVSLESPVVDGRGTMLIFVEEALQVPLSMELERLEYDLAGDGWKVIWHPVATDATVATVKSQIVTDYSVSPASVRSVLLLGEIPVPYSGNSAWDGHSNHQGAWPADTYYGDIDGVWTDEIINNTTPSRPANDNVPGDGKFDQSITPSALEIAVGRVDFSNLNETTFGTTRTELMRRYLDKNHNWRTKKYTVSNQAMVDDNFGYFGGEAFAANGYRNYYPVVGVDNVMDADFFDDTDDQSYLFGYGCGGGSYTSASGVGTSDNFASDTVNIAFAMLFGSFHGDWDSENNPFMPSALASEGGILSCSWAGRPHWFYQALAAGETLGYCGLATQNSCDNIGYFGSIGECGAHVTLLGDPSLRVHVVDPATALTTSNKCHSVELAWSGSAAPNVEGYLVYRANSLHGDYTRLTPQPMMPTTFTDNNPNDGDNYYQIKAVVLETTPSGSYFNTSTGVLANTFFETGTPPSIAIVADTLTCLNQMVTIAATTDAAQPTYQWTGPGNFSSNEPTIVVDIIGEYNLVVTDGISGCTNMESATVVQDASLPVAAPAASNDFDCVNTTVQLFANPEMAGYTFEWTGPNGFTSSEENPFATTIGDYFLVVSAPNGCIGAYSTEVIENTDVPIAMATNGMLNCLTPEIILDGSGSSSGPNYVYQWSTLDGIIVSGGNTLTPIVGDCGTYTLTIVDVSNGCTASTSLEVVCDLELPDLSLEGDTEISCAEDLVTLTASSTTPGATFAWEGPGIINPGNPTQTIAAGLYVISVIGPNGCSNSQAVQLVGPDQMQVSVITVLVDCNGFESIDAIVTGGVAPYIYEFTPMPPIPPNTDYSVVVTDANGCTATAMGTTPDFEPLMVNVSHTDETISGMNDGTATANGMNGVPPYSYEWSNGGDTQTITDLPPGLYSVTITDGNGCAATNLVEVMGGALAAEDIPGLQSLSLSPNPTSGAFEISIKLDAPKPISVEVVDAIGRTVFQSVVEYSAAKTWLLDLSNVPAGIYFCKIKIGEQTVGKRVVRL